MPRLPLDISDVDEVVIDRLVAGIPVAFTGADRVAAVRRMRLAGWSYSRIADQLHTSERQVARDLARLRMTDETLRPRRIGQAKRRRQAAVPLLQAGWRNADIARLLAVPAWLIAQDRARLLPSMDVHDARTVAS